MKTKLRNILLLLLAIVMLVNQLPMVAFATGIEAEEQVTTVPEATEPEATEPSTPPVSNKSVDFALFLDTTSNNNKTTVA